MKILDCIVTIQWGQGMHYVTSTHDHIKEATASAVEQRQRVNSRLSKRGAKPTVRTWKIVEE